MGFSLSAVVGGLAGRLAPVLGLAVACGGCSSDREQCASDAPTRKTCESACEADDADSCHRLARILDELEHVDPELVMKALDRSCELGSASGCIKRRGYCSGSAEDQESLSDEQKACRETFSQKACDLGDDLACRQLRLAREKALKDEEKKKADKERK